MVHERQEISQNLTALRLDELKPITQILYPTRSKLLTIDDVFGLEVSQEISTSPCIEIGGMPHLGKSGMLRMFARDSSHRGVKIRLISEKPTIARDDDDFYLGLHNLSFIFGSLPTILNKASAGHGDILDRGLLGQIAFIQALEIIDILSKSQANTAIDFIVSNFSGLVDTLIICNANPGINLKPLNPKLFTPVFETALSNSFRELPETIRKTRNKLDQLFPPLTFINLEFDTDWNKSRYMFFRALGSAVNGIF